MNVRYATVCSGVEAVSLAWEGLGGFEPVFFSEIEAFPSAVLAARWPHVPNLGDLTGIVGADYARRVDVLWSSLPCQAFSTVGKRRGLRDQRGALFRPFLKLADDIAAPVVVMENVVGLRSDPVFARILRGLSGSIRRGAIGLDDTHDGPKRRLAWRVLDSGTVQRRPRLFLVGCSVASGLDPRSLLPECESLSRDRGADARRLPSGTHEGSVIWLNADTTPKWSRTAVGTFRATDGSGGRSLVCVDGRVRELMPCERERLMGWSGHHTDIPWRGTARTLDIARNRAIGNSLALAPVREIGRRIGAAMAWRVAA